MKILSLKIIVCAIIIYVIAVFGFNLNEYWYFNSDLFWQMEWWQCELLIAFIYFAIVAIIITFVYGMKSLRNKAITKSISAQIIKYYKSQEKMEQNNKPKVRDIPEYADQSKIHSTSGNNWNGTGIYGMTKYTQICFIIGWVCCVLGAVLLLVGVMEQLSSTINPYEWCIYSGLFFIIGGINCIILTPFIKALITITKAATKYLHNNQ